jgi:hypothetical protein
MALAPMLLALASTLGMPAASCAADAGPATTPVTEVVTSEPLPPPAAGHHVVADATTLVFQAKDRTRTLRDLDSEAADTIAEINRSPGTWQSYLLYTSRDLPDKLFLPGFTFQLDRPKAARPHLVLATRPADPKRPPLGPGSSAGEAR